jgi:hypothetical protein
MHAMVAFHGNDPDAGGPSPEDVFDYAEVMALELAVLCEQAGAGRAAGKFREAAEVLRQPLNAAPGDAA